MCAQKPKGKADETLTEPEPPNEPPSEPPELAPEVVPPDPEPPEPPPEPEPQPHPLEERLSKAEAEVARLRAEADILRANVKRSPLFKRLGELLDKPII